MSLNNYALLSLCLSLLSLSQISFSRVLKQEDDLQVLMLWGEYVYHVSNNPASYDEAAASCTALGAELLQVESPYESFTVARRFAGSDYGDHAMNTYTGVNWQAGDVKDKMVFWIGNSVEDSGSEQVAEPVDDIWEYESYSVSGLLSQLDGDSRCIYMEARVKYNPDGEWNNDLPCSSKFHYVCRQPVSTFKPPSTPVPVFLSLTVDCIVSPKQLEIEDVYENENELLAFVPYPQSCSLKGYKSSTAVTSLDILLTKPMPVKYYIVDPTRVQNLPGSFQGGLVSYVNSVDDMLAFNEEIQLLY